MRIESMFVGKPKTVVFRGKTHSTAIFKEPVSGPVILRAMNLEGDEQADLRVHGGVNKALYAYGVDAYPLWKKQRPQDLFAHGAMGENLAMETLPEDQMYVGDTYRLGSAIIAVAQPRFPCFKLGIKFGDPGILKQFMELERPGVYFRVVQEGSVDRGDRLEITSREKTRVSILELFRLPSAQSVDKGRLQEILGVKGLPAQWRVEIQGMLSP